LYGSLAVSHDDRVLADELVKAHLGKYADLKEAFDAVNAKCEYL
jgi:hypothetical protein